MVPRQSENLLTAEGNELQMVGLGFVHFNLLETRDVSIESASAGWLRLVGTLSSCQLLSINKINQSVAQCSRSLTEHLCNSHFHYSAGFPFNCMV